MDIFEQVERNIDRLVEEKADWTFGADKSQLEAARAGRLPIGFFDRELPAEWFADIKYKRVLCLAGAGGLQAPLLACAGAEVTVLDISEKMLEKDRAAAKAGSLDIRLVKGNMCDLSMFGGGSFDLILNPPSMMYVPEPRTVFAECSRVLVNGGTFIMMAPAPINYVCDFVSDDDGGYYKAVHKMPFCSAGQVGSDWIEFGHSMEEYLGGLTDHGFVITGYTECQREDITELFFAVRAEKR